MSSRWKKYEELVKLWRSEVLQGIDKVPITGTLGTCLVYKEQSVSILSGSKPQNVSMAAATLGNGRVFAITHNGYLNNQDFRKQPNVKKLLANIYTWVSQGQYKGDEDVHELKNKNANFQGKKILFWSGAAVNGISSEQVVEFVENGGGLVHAMTPWGWLQLNPGKKLEDMPFIQVLLAAGLFYTGDCCHNSGHFPVSLSDAVNHNEAMQNIGYALSCAKTPDVLMKCGEHLCQGLAAAPELVKREMVDGMKEVYNCYKSQMCTPCCSQPMKDPNQRCLTLLMDQLCDIGLEDMRCISYVDDFLGKCGDGPTVCVEKEFVAKLKNFHSVGLYARPGAEIKVDVLSDQSTLQDGWVFRIGSHTDDNTRLDAWKRWPKLVKRQKLSSAHLTTFSPYGGLIYLENPDFKTVHSIRVRVSGGIEAPMYDLKAPDSKEKWLACRDAPGPWTDLNGRHISFTMPSSSVRHIDDPEPALVVWDCVIEAHCGLRGTDPSEHPHQWVVCDAQPVAGYMHAGYPVVTMMDVADPKAPDRFLLNPDRILSKGCWGMFHELGHNMQRPWWTFRGTGEVTCNIFTLHAMDVVSNKKPWIHEWLANQLPNIKKALKKENPYEVWVNDPGVALGIYAQLQHCFGWDAYKAVFAHYEALDKNRLPKGDQKQLTYWIEQFSKTVGYDLCPLFEFWGFKLPDSLSRELSLPPFLPDDEMTQMAPQRVEFLQNVYPGLVRQA